MPIRRPLVPLFAFACTAAAAACGGPPPPTTVLPAASAKADAGAVTVSTITPPLGTETSQVDEPKNLLVTGRVANVARTLKAVHAWSQLPMPKDDAITEIMTSEAVGGLVDLDKPVDFAVAVTGTGAHMKEQVAISAAVKDFEKAKQAFLEHFKLSAGPDGTLHVDGLGRPPSGKDSDDDDDDDDGPPSAGHKPAGGDKAKDDENEDRRHCALSPAFGDAPVRLVCGFTLGALRALGPYLTRTVTRTPPSSDLTVQLKMAPLKQVISEQKPMVRGVLTTILGVRGANRGINDLVGAVGQDAADLALDLDTATLEAKIAEDGVNATLTAKLGGSNATVSKLATAHPERTDVPPAAFWQLPGDAELAFFQRGMEKSEFETVRDLLAGVVTGQLAADGVTDPERGQVGDAFKKMLSSSAGVYASGLDVPTVRRAFADQRKIDRFSYGSSTPESEKLEARRVAAEAIFGWRVFGMEDAPSKYTQAAKDFVAAWGKPNVTKALKAKHKDGPIPAVRIGAAPKGAPKDTTHLEVDLYPYQPRATPKKEKDKDDKAAPPPKPQKPLRLHVLIVPDGGRTWITVAADEALAVAKANAVLASAPDDGKLAKRQGLDALRGAKLGAGGFFTQRAAPSLSEQLAVLNGNFYGVGEHYDDMTASQHGGTTPMIFTFTAQPPAGGGSQFAATIQMPRPALEDFVVAFIKKVTGG